MNTWPNLLATTVASSFLLVGISGYQAGAQETPKEKVKRVVSAEVIDRVEKLLAVLAEETKLANGSFIAPCPSQETAYFLLKGLADEGTELKLTEKEKQAYRGSAQEFSIAEDVRVRISVAWMQDRSGSYYLKQASLKRLKDGAWKNHGNGVHVSESK
jgi:hypothetical protein